MSQDDKKCSNNCAQCSRNTPSSPFKSRFSPDNIQTYYQPAILHETEKYFYYDSTINAAIIFYPQEGGPSLFAAFLHKFNVIIHFIETPHAFNPTKTTPMHLLDDSAKKYCALISPAQSELKEDIPCPPYVQILMASLYEIESMMDHTPAAETLAFQGIAIQ